MKIIVLIKQVPATDKVKMDEETGTMIREGIESEVNPLDLYAIEEAVRIKERKGEGVEISVISMGPKMAVEAIRSAIALGCDKGYLLSDRKFAGSDTWGTAYALSVGIRRSKANSIWSFAVRGRPMARPGRSDRKWGPTCACRFSLMSAR